MFPYIIINWVKIYMVWVWIVIATIFFLISMYRYCKKYNLSFGRFFNWLSWFIILPYIFWRYVYDLIEYHFIVPNDFLELISPFRYHFSFIWVSLGFIIITAMFLKTIHYKEERKKWIDVIFFSLMWFLFILWFFLVLWDNFYSKITSDMFWVAALVQDSKLIGIWKVLPIWIFVSVLALLLFIIVKIIYWLTKKNWMSIIWYILLFVWFGIIFKYQYYIKHFVFWHLDIKIFYCFSMPVILISLYYLIVERNK